MSEINTEDVVVISLVLVVKDLEVLLMLSTRWLTDPGVDTKTDLQSCSQLVRLPEFGE